MKKPLNLILATLINAHRSLYGAIILFLLYITVPLSATAQEKWTYVGKSGITGPSADPMNLEFNSYGTLYIAYIEDLGSIKLGDRAFVKKYDGTEWVGLGSLPIVQKNMLSMTVSNTGQPCVAYVDTASYDKITVCKYNGASWQRIGADIQTTGVSQNIHLTENKGKLYLAYIDAGKHDLITVMSFDNGLWSVIGQSSLVDNTVRYCQLLFDNLGAPIVVYCGGVPGSIKYNDIVAMRFDGNAWVQAAKRISVGEVLFFKALIDKSGDLCLAYHQQETVYPYKAPLKVSKYNGVNWQPIGDSTYFSGFGIGAKASFIVGCDSAICIFNDAYGLGLTLLSEYKNGSWKPVGPLLSGEEADRAYHPIPAVDCNGTYYSAFISLDSNKVRVKRFGVSGWTDVGQPIKAIKSDDDMYVSSFQFSNKGVAYLSCREPYGSASDTRLRAYSNNGGVWTQLVFDKDSLIYTDFKLSTNDTPYVFCNVSAEGSVIKKFDGTQWLRTARVGVNNVSPYYDIFLGLGMFCFGKNDTLYSAGWGANGKFGVAKYDGLNWVVLADTQISVNWLARYSFALDNMDRPYFAYTDDSKGQRATVLKCENGVWSVVGSSGFSPGTAAYCSLGFDTSNVPYVVYGNNSVTVSGLTTVARFNGTNWETVGDTCFSSGHALGFVIAFNKNNTPYVAYKDWANSVGATVMKYNGRVWFPVGAQGFSHNQGAHNTPVRLSFGDNNTPYVATTHRVYDKSFVSVMKYGCPVQPQADICAVYTDTVTNKNIITWDGSTLPAIDSFRIYRENNGLYQYLGGVARNKYSYVDGTAKPDVQSYRYRLVLVDNCEREADTNSLNAHKSIQLTFNYLLQGIASVGWNTYEGRSNLVYTLKRSNNGAVFTDLASFSIAGNDTTYLDVNPPSGSNEYRVDVALNDFCNVSGGSYDKITSNKVTAWNTGIEHASESGKGLLLVPNPADKNVHVVATDKIAAVEVFTVTGKRLFSANGYEAREVDIDVSQYPSGVYYVRVNGVNNASFLKR